MPSDLLHLITVNSSFQNMAGFQKTPHIFVAGQRIHCPVAHRRFYVASVGGRICQPHGGFKMFFVSVLISVLMDWTLPLSQALYDPFTLSELDEALRKCDRRRDVGSYSVTYLAQRNLDATVPVAWQHDRRDAIGRYIQRHHSVACISAGVAFVQVFTQGLPH